MSVMERLALRRNEKTHRIGRLPVLVLLPHSRCNCRCVMCDIWRANRQLKEISPEVLESHVQSMAALGVRWIVLSGGEALMHRNLWTLCQALQPLRAKLTLLSTGLLMKRDAANIGRWVDEVIVSLDGSPEVHDRIRNVPRAYERLAEGIVAVRSVAPGITIGGRCVLQRANFSDFSGVVEAAHDLNLDWISFLAADVSSEAFNRPGGWPQEQAETVSLSLQECDQLERLLHASFVADSVDYDSGFIVESPQRLLKLVQYFRALAGEGDFPVQACNAPWVSAVVEPDGEVRPCYFHESYGNIEESGLQDILNSRSAVEFRRNLDINNNPVCRRCVCTLNLR